MFCKENFRVERPTDNNYITGKYKGMRFCYAYSDPDRILFCAEDVPLFLKYMDQEIFQTIPQVGRENAYVDLSFLFRIKLKDIEHIAELLAIQTMLDLERDLLKELKEKKEEDND